MLEMQETQVRFWVGKIPRSRKWQPTPVFLSGKFHGQRSLAGMWSWRVGRDWARKNTREYCPVHPASRSGHRTSFLHCNVLETMYITSRPKLVRFPLSPTECSGWGPREALGATDHTYEQPGSLNHCKEPADNLEPLLQTNVWQMTFCVGLNFVFLGLSISHGWMSLVGCNPWGR